MRIIGPLLEEAVLLKQAAENGSNIFPLIIESVKANATLGEISNTLRDVFGEYKG